MKAAYGSILLVATLMSSLPPHAVLTEAIPLAPSPAQAALHNPLLSPTTYAEPSCSNNEEPQNLSGWKRWSELSTWPGESQIPGSNATLGNVTIGCGDYILYDVPPLDNGTSAVKLSVLLVKGHLMFLDDLSVPELALDADYIIVTGNFTIGSANQHYRQKARITLTNNTKALVPGYEDVGFKVLAAVGGQINFYGMPQGPQTPSWVSLTSLAAANDTILHVDQDVSQWPVGGKIVIASTDFDPHQGETASIVAAAGHQLYLDTALNYTHFAASVPTGYQNITMPMAAEVALLTRNILVTAIVGSGADNLTGGHVIVYNTQAAQSFVGVEITNMGQQGTLGRYPLHFHMCGPMPDSTVQSNSVHNTLQRGYVIHGTHWLTAEDNVAFNATGHVFMLEDGIEQNNTLRHNLVINSRPATVLIPEDPVNTDNTPSCFWTATPTNNFTNNTAVGCDSGFWPELLVGVRGECAALPGASSVKPYSDNLGLFTDNVAHSNTNMGLKMYDHGYRPINNQTFSRMRAYKNAMNGISFHGCSNLIVEGAMVADNLQGIELESQAGLVAQNNIIIGRSQNLGNAVNCKPGGSAACEPVSGFCGKGFNVSKLPANPGLGYRTVSQYVVGGATCGLVLGANTAINNVFVNFNDTCSSTGAIGINNAQPGNLPVTGVTWNNTFINTPQANKVWIDPALALNEGQYWAAKDNDGSTLGYMGYMVANGSALMMPAPNSNVCTNMSAWGGYSCKGLCYRSMFMNYTQPGNNQTNATTIVVTSMADSAKQTLYQGTNFLYVIDTGMNSTYRYTFFNLIGGRNYSVQFTGPAGVPSAVEYGYKDGDQAIVACNANATLIFQKGVKAIPKSS